MAFSNSRNGRNCNLKTEEEEQSVLFFQCAHLILPWLTPSELANTSLTCKTVFQFSKCITISRSLDASRSLENLPIPFHNTLDDVPYAYFIYTPSQIIPSSPSQSPQRQLWGSSFDAKLKPIVLRQLGRDSGAAFSDLVDDPNQNCKELGPLGGLISDVKLKPNSLSELCPDPVSQSGAGFMGLVADPDQKSVEDSGPCSRRMNQLGAWGPRYEKVSQGCIDPVSVVEDLSEDECGCECEKCLEVGDDNGVFGCPCFSGLQDVGIVSECGPSCGCGLECENRLSQRGISVRLMVVRAVKKGWGLFADQFIPRGQFICEYAGELLTTKEARRRQKIYDELASRDGISSALLVVREHLPSGKACLRMNIDATRVGNVARFINHSCDGGNLSTVLVRSSGALLPRLCFFASKDIKEGEEITFSYGEIRVRPKGLPCFCGSSFCFGILPSEHT